LRVSLVITERRSSWIGVANKSTPQANRFLESLSEDRRRSVEEELREPVDSLERGVLPHQRLDIRRLKGGWEGFLRLRVGDIRIIFRIDFEFKIIYIYHIHYRESIYK